MMSSDHSAELSLSRRQLVAAIPLVLLGPAGVWAATNELAPLPATNATAKHWHTWTTPQMPIPNAICLAPKRPATTVCTTSRLTRKAVVAHCSPASK